MPYNSETETFYQAPATVVDSTPDGDTVQEGFDDRLTPAITALYDDLNLLKADGMISVGIPATTTARGIGRVAASDDLVDGATINNGPAFIAAGVNASVASAAGKVPVADADGTVNNWTGARYATCSTAAATAAKVADLANLQLVKGSRIFVTFSNANTVADAITLNVNSTGAKPVYNERGAVSSTNTATWFTGVPIEFVYDGNYWWYKTVDAVGNAIGQYFYVRDVKTAGTSGGSTSSSTWQTRDLNTIVHNNIGASLSANRFTLPAGVYRIFARVPGSGIYRFRAALYNVTASSYPLLSNNGYSDYTYPTNCYVDIDGVVELSAPAQFELRMFCQSAWTHGMGYPTNLEMQEYYSEVCAWKM